MVTHKQKGSSVVPVGKACDRVFNFFMNIFIGRGLKRTTLSFDAKNDEDHLLVCTTSPVHEDSVHHHNVQIHFMQNIEGEEEDEHEQLYVTPLNNFASPARQVKGGLGSVTGGNSSVKPVGVIGGTEGNNKNRSNVASSDANHAMTSGEDQYYPRSLISVAPNINEKSDAFIRSRKLAMSLDD